MRYSFYEKSKAVALMILLSGVFFWGIKVFFGMEVLKMVVPIIICLVLLNIMLNKFEEGR